jgi:hypothetical protein
MEEKEDPFPEERPLGRHCCRKCEAVDKGKRSCICVVPKSHRRVQINEGCVPCGCKGCSKEDVPVTPRFQCCEKCEKAKNNKPCFCQLPKNQRKSWVAIEGCKVCGCKGCNPHERKRSRSRERSRERRSSSESSLEVNESANNLRNFDRTILGEMLASVMIHPPVLGFAIPQRTYSYIMGKPR